MSCRHAARISVLTCATLMFALAGSAQAATPLPFELRSDLAQDGLNQEHADDASDDDSGASPYLRGTLFGLGQLSLQYAALLVYDPANWHGYGNSATPSLSKFGDNFTRPPVFEPVRFGGGGLLGIAQADGDPWTVNVLGHGVQGAELYLRLRREGFAASSSLIGGVIQSVVWEYGFEGVHETPSMWDLFYTPLGGALLGEARYRVLRLARARSGAPGFRMLTWIADPVGELDALLNKTLYGRR
ncbi:MAG: DUF3943 domain-containing protein [Pseudomonadota bacterium]